MTETEERQALTYEIKARENLLKRLEYPRKQLESAVKKEDEQRQTILREQCCAYGQTVRVTICVANAARDNGTVEVRDQQFQV